MSEINDKPLTDKESDRIKTLIQQNIELGQLAKKLFAQMERLRKGPKGWEDQHQYRVLENFSLTGEFGTMGCDAIEGVCDALVQARLKALQVAKWVKDLRVAVGEAIDEAHENKNELMEETVQKLERAFEERPESGQGKGDDYEKSDDDEDDGEDYVATQPDEDDDEEDDGDDEDEE